MIRLRSDFYPEGVSPYSPGLLAWRATLGDVPRRAFSTRNGLRPLDPESNGTTPLGLKTTGGVIPIPGNNGASRFPQSPAFATPGPSCQALLILGIGITDYFAFAKCSPVADKGLSPDHSERTTEDTENTKSTRIQNQNPMSRLCSVLNARFQLNSFFGFMFRVFRVFRGE